MDNRKKTGMVFLAGILAGIAIAVTITFGLGTRNHETGQMAEQQTVSANNVESTELAKSEEPLKPEVSAGTEETQMETLIQSEETVPIISEIQQTKIPLSGNYWDTKTTYLGGDTVTYQGRMYRAKWWTLGEEPGHADVWEDTGAASVPETTAETTGSKLAETTKMVGKSGKKVVGYFPEWKAGQIGQLRYDVLTHVVYAFAIPTQDGGLLPLENPEAARRLIQKAHENQVQVLLAVGGWSYHEIPLETTFVSATDTPEKLAAFGDAILAMCDAYGFDGVDMDWEHPRVDGSFAQYEKLMVYLSEQLHERGKILTSAVIGGVTADGYVSYDSAAHTDQVLAAVDWIHVMAYDGGDGDRHSSYEFAVNCGNYWKNSRNLPSDKVVLGVPFYGRPGWFSYGEILAADSQAWNKDIAMVNGMEVHYNGQKTIEQKTRYAVSELGGVMIWEVTQDTGNRTESLMNAIQAGMGQK